MRKFENLTNEELVVYYQTNEGYEKADSLETLLKRMEGIMIKFARAYSNIPNLDEEDRIAELQIAYLRILDKFDIERGFTLTTYCKTGFKQVLDKLYRDKTRKVRFDKDVIHTSYEVMVETKQDGEECDMGVKTDTYCNIEYIDMIETIGLTEKEKLTCYMISAGKNKAQIAKILGVSNMAVKYYLDSVRKKMEKAGCI